MVQYYFLATILPDITLGVKPELEKEEFLNLLKDNLSIGDMEKVVAIRWLYDIYNLRAFQLGLPLDSWGNLDEEGLKETLLIGKEALPKFMSKALESDEYDKFDLKNFPLLIDIYFKQVTREYPGFVSLYTNFERSLRLMLTAFRAKKLGKELTKEFQFKDPSEEFIIQLLSYQDAKSFEPPPEYEDLKPILNATYSSPKEFQKALLEYRFIHLDSLIGLNVFSSDRILFYFIKYIIADKWAKLDKEQGLQIVESITGNIV